MISQIEYKEAWNMEQTAQQRFSRVLALAAADPVYQDLQHECARLDQGVLAALEKLSPEDRTVIRDYIHTLGTSALRLTEIACEAT